MNTRAGNNKTTDRFDWLPLDWQPGQSLRRHESGVVLGRFLGAELSSVYQPIIDVASGQAIGYEAFVRCHAGGEAALSPWNLFSLVADDATLVGLDRLCRTLHVLNDLRTEEDELLFLNVHGRLLAAVSEDHGAAFRRVLDVLQVRSGNVVIETPEVACRDLRLLSFVHANYRINGFRVAANVASLADAEAVLGQMRPNFIKIDVRYLRNGDERGRLVELAAVHGTSVVFTRVAQGELLDELRAATGVLAQGHAIAEAAPPRRESIRQFRAA
ncbi:EAL domain-containing protein [Pseudothauera rhizosphaerae]|nr:EAL domain-containing protein [Pseudothauera rhizosphaerae]